MLDGYEDVVVTEINNSESKKVGQMKININTCVFVYVLVFLFFFA